MAFLYFLALFFIILAQKSKRMTVGFEVELRELFTREIGYATQSRAFLYTDMWQLFSDEVGYPGATPEFATIGALNFNNILKAAEDIQAVLNKFIDKIRNRINFLYEFKDIIKLNDDLRKAQNKIMYHYIRDQYHNESNTAYYDYLLGLYEILCKSFYSLVDESYCDKKLARLVNKINGKIEQFMIKNKHYYDKDNDKYAIINKELLNQTHKISLTTEKDITLIIDEKIKEKIKAIEDLGGKENAITDYEELVKTYLTKLNSVIDKIEKNEEIIHNLHANKKFTLLYKMQNSIPIDDNMFIFDCRNVTLGFQFTLGLLLSDIPTLLNYYASLYSEEISPDTEAISSSNPYEPQLLIQLSYLLINPSFENSISDVNLDFITLWNKKHSYIFGKALDIVMEDSIESISKNEINEATGLFYMILMYGVRLFNLSGDEEIAKKVSEELNYGPKKLTPIMSRISFSELYDNLGENSKLYLLEILKELCSLELDSSSLTKFYNQSNESPCSNFILLHYSTYRYDEEELNKDPIKMNNSTSFLDWLNSIVFKKHRSKQQYKNKLSNYQETKEIDSDILSPPPGFRSSSNTDYNDYDTDDYYKYSMGAYTGITKGQILIELRAYSSLPIKACDLSKYIKQQTAKFYSILGYKIEGKEHVLDDIKYIKI